MYRAVLFADDGDWVTDFTRDTLEEVATELADMGSRWYFYPYQAIFKMQDGSSSLINANGIKIEDAAFPIEHMAGLTIQEASEEIRDNFVPPID